DLGDLVASGDAGAIRQATHRLRGSSGNVGALEVTRLLAELEELTAAGGLDGATALVAGIVTAFEPAAAALRDRHAPASCMGPSAPRPAGGAVLQPVPPTGFEPVPPP
ncbi:MAG: Hpt domain, partial [Actinomycetota bacterium]|nr:Hpt domain [Actinomycetota bacterium]